MKYAIALILALALALPAFAGYTYQTAKHSYYIDVRNSNFRDIWGAYVTVSESGTHSAYVNVRAQGYRDAHGYVSINPSQHSVHVQI
ncbi:MAG: hypothetical protein HY815_05870, partial [Candidatus Riflebacteria bacterium]|nr:hypothetical protein [Candidatus Riflebacteria bacterium]